MRAKELLIERVLNIHDSKGKRIVADTVWDMLQQSYANVPGGFRTADTIDELINKSSLWKVVTRGGKITAVTIYKDQFGRKSIASCTDGTPQGKKDYAMIRSDDHTLQRAWAEVSGAPEHIMRKNGATPILAKFAHILTKRKILSYNEDGFHYTRLIGGEPHEKIIYGSVKFTEDEVVQLAAEGISLHELPHTFK